MRLLLCLAQHEGEVVSIENLLDELWVGVIVTPDSVYQAVASLRRVLGDDPKRPTYVANVPRLGYRMVASVGLWVDEPGAPPSSPLGGNTLRVTTRLIRADDGYVIWAETYDRPLDNELKIQDEIAGTVAKTLGDSIN